jgi:hypothetical protein
MDIDHAARAVTTAIREAGHPLAEDEIWIAVGQSLGCVRWSVDKPIQYAVDAGWLLRIEGHRHAYSDPIERMVAPRLSVCQCRHGRERLDGQSNTDALHRITVFAVNPSIREPRP